jgi:hypothetical protein
LEIILMKMHCRQDPGLIGGWRGKVASQKMLLFYSDAELGCDGIDFDQNLFCSWLVGNGESYLKVGEDGSRAEELWMFPSLATTRPLSEPGKRINNNLKRLVETPKSTSAPVTVPGLSLNHTGGSFLSELVQ